MLTLVKSVDLYTPEHLGERDVLFTNNTIIAIAPSIELEGVEVTILDRKGTIMIPGLIDNHVHILGGGGEAGYHSRVPEATIETFVTNGITTVIGLLGTDGYTRNMENLIAKAKGLKNEGLSVYALTGSYQIPVKTLTNSIENDILFIEEIIGTGEIAISDHRSSQPSLESLKAVFSKTHVAGLLSGKAGVTNVHVGSYKSRLQPIIDILTSTSLPAHTILPTHINRTEALFEEGINYAKTFQAPIDFTATKDKHDALSAYQTFKRALEAGVDITNITMSSDGQGSLPVFDKKNRLTGMKIGDVSSLYETVVNAVIKADIPLEKALYPVTKNVSTIYNLPKKGEIKEQNDADLIIIDKDFTIHDVFLGGNHVLKEKKIRIKSTFKEDTT